MQKTFFDDPPTPVEKWVEDLAKARASDPITSHEAADKTNVKRSHELVLRQLAKVHAATAEQVLRLCELNNEKISASRVRGALSELVAAKKVVELSRDGTTECGLRCTLYQIKGA